MTDAAPRPSGRKMFFPLSKLIFFVLTPSNFLILLGLLGIDADFHRMALILQTLFQSIAHAARRIYYQNIGHSRRLKCYGKI